MAESTGLNTKTAAKRPIETSAYGTDAAATITNMIPLLSENITNAPDYDVEEALIGVAAPQDSDIIAWRTGGAITVEAWYESLEYLYTAAFGFQPPDVYTGVFGTGSGGSPAPDVSPTPTAYCHLWELDDTVHRKAWSTDERSVSSGGSSDPTYWTAGDQKVRAFSLCIDKKQPTAAVHHFQDCMVRRATLRITPQQIAWEFDLSIRKHDRTSDRNRSSWALPTNRNRLLFPQVRFYLDNIGATMSTEYPIQEAEITIENSLQEEYATGSTAVYQIEPARNAFRKVRGRLKIARFSTTQYNTLLDAGTIQQAMLQITGGTIGAGAKSFQQTLAFPSLKITKADWPVSGPGIVTGDIEFEATKPTWAALTWLSTLLGGMIPRKNSELYMFLWNSRPWCWIRDRQAAAAGVLP